jgi:hypothetical protein
MNLFPSHMGSINGLLTGAFDTSSLIFMIFKVRVVSPATPQRCNARRGPRQQSAVRGGAYT